MFYWLTVAMVLFNPWQVDDSRLREQSIEENDSHPGNIVVDSPVQQDASNPLCCGPEPPPPPPPPEKG